MLCSRGGSPPPVGEVEQLRGDLIPALDREQVEILEDRGVVFLEAVTQRHAPPRIDYPVAQVAIGDGANDLLMLSRAAFGVAIHAKPLVQQQAQVALNFHDLDGLVGLLQSSACLENDWS